MTTATDLVRLGDIGTDRVWFTSIGHPAGCDLVAESGDPLSVPRDEWWDLQGTLSGDRWEWDGKGNPIDWKGNTVQRIVAFVPK